MGATGPHDPYLVPQKYLDLYDLDDVPLPASYADTLADKPGLYRRMRESLFGQRRAGPLWPGRSVQAAPLMRLRIRMTKNVSQGEALRLSANDQPFHDWYIEPAV